MDTPFVLQEVVLGVGRNLEDDSKRVIAVEFVVNVLVSDVCGFEALLSEAAAHFKHALRNVAA